MPSQFGGIPVDAPAPAGSKFGGSPVASGGSTAPAKPDQSFGAAVREYAHKMNPLSMFQGLANATSSPEGTGAAVNAYGQQNEKMLHDASDAYQNGDYTGAARHFFHYLLNGVPGLGSSLEEAGNKFQQHDFAGGLADTAALATQISAGAKAPEIAGTLRDAGAEAVDSVRPTPKPAEPPAAGTASPSTPATGAGRLRTAAAKFGLKQIKKASGLDTVSDAYDALKDAGVIGGDQIPAPQPQPAATPPPAAAAAPTAAAAPKPSPLRPPLAEGTPPAPAPPDIPTPNAGGGGPLRAPVRGQVPAPPPPPNPDDTEFLADYNRAVKMPPPAPGPDIPPDQPLLKEGAPPPPPPADNPGGTANLPPEPPSPAQQAEGPPAATATPPAPPVNMSKADWTQYQSDLKASGFKTDPGAYPGAKPGSRIGQSFARSARGQVAPKSVRTFPSEQLEPFATNEGMSVENAYDALKSNGWLVKYPAATQPVQ